MPLFFQKARRGKMLTANAQHGAKQRSIRYLIYLSWADLDVEVASLVRDLEDFGPCESVDPEAVSVDEQTVGAHSEHYIDSL